jgi:CubicO group peptidase (beta-lactamase class C family)
MTTCILTAFLVFYSNGAIANKNVYENAASKSIELDSGKLTKKIEQSLDKLSVVQGLSIAVYYPNGHYVAGFGVSDNDSHEKVSTDTVFYIASSTKSMLALLMSIKHEQGEVNLDQSLRDFAPSAPFPKNINAHQITIRNLLSMSSGIKHPAYVHRVAYSGEHNQNLLWDLIGQTKPNQSKKIRLGHFRYTNWNYNLLARLVEQNTRQTWQQMLQSEIFNKLGMTRTTAYISKAEKEGWSIARPHSSIGGDAPRRSYLEKTDKTMQSAGGVYMSAKDALTWLDLFINDGAVNGKPVFAAKAIQATREPLTAANTRFGPYQRDFYGLGWYIGRYGKDNIKFVHHFGGFSGARAHISYMPEKNIGVAVFVNDSQVGSKLVDVIANYVYDSLLGYESSPDSFNMKLDEIVEWKEDTNTKIAAQRERISQRKWSLERPLKDYQGTYINEEFGTIKIEVEANTLRVTNGNLTALAQAGDNPESIMVELIPLNGQYLKFKSVFFGFGSIQAVEYEGVIFELLN